MKDIISKPPFNLNDEQIKWVEETFNGLTEDEKIGQLFIIVSGMNPADNVVDTVNKFKPGGFMYRPLPKDAISQAHKAIQEASKVPCFLAANTEAGGAGLVADVGVDAGNNMQVGATNDPSLAYKQGKLAAETLVGSGANMSFAPVVDINFNWRNPITNVRAYSDEVEKVAKFSVQNVLGTQEHGAAVTVKHFPGDGIDSRDHHIAPAMNQLNLEEWMASYGKVYKDCFEVGALATMVGHFVVPNLIEDLGGPAEHKWLASSLNRTVLKDLLRDKLGFNGLALTDATSMVGMTTMMARKELVPFSIEAGCDVFLFAKSIDEDFQSMKDGLKNGILSQERLDEAVTRILATKAALNLHINDHSDLAGIDKIGSEEHKAIEAEVADKSVTLVKNEQNLFPMNGIKNIKLVQFIEKGLFEEENTTLNYILKKFEDEGVSVDLFDATNFPALMMTMGAPLQNDIDKYDAIIYVSNVVSASNKSNLSIDWKALGLDAPGHAADIKTAWISFGSPYHLNDAPWVRNFINAYNSKPKTIDATFDKMFGRSEFKGVSPVNEDVRYPYYDKEIDIKYDYWK